jgi:hypothetical protein
MKDDLKVPPARDLPPGRRRQRREHLVTELNRMEHERRRRPKLLLAATAGVVVLVAASLGVHARWGGWNQNPPENLEASSRWYFSDPRDMVATSDLVVLGTVTAVERDGVSDQGDVVYTTRLLHVTVDKRLFGTMTSNPVIVEDLGWEKAGGRREVPWRMQGMIRLEVGDRAILFLRKDPTTGRFGLLSPQAGYRVDGPNIADTDRTDLLVRRIEAMSVSELERLIDEAAAALRRGELEPIPEGGRRKAQSP